MCWRRASRYWAAAGLLLVALAGCGGRDYVTVPPATRAELVEGVRLVYVGAGDYEWTHELVALRRGYRTWVTGDGWRWTRRDPFSPFIAWQGPGERGRQVVLGDMTELFPLTVGDSAIVEYSGSSDTAPEVWRLQRQCTVESQRRSSVPAGDFDTFRVVCVDGVATERPSQRRVFHYAPALGVVVASRAKRQDQPAEEWLLKRMDVPARSR